MTPETYTPEMRAADAKAIRNMLGHWLSSDQMNLIHRIETELPRMVPWEVVEKLLDFGISTTEFENVFTALEKWRPTDAR